MTDEEKKYGDSDFLRRTTEPTRSRNNGAKGKRSKFTELSFKGLTDNIRKGVIEKKIKKYNKEYFELRRLAEEYEKTSKEEGANYNYDKVVSSAKRYNKQMERLAKLGARILVWDDDISKIRVRKGGRPIKVPGWAVGPLGSVWAWYTEKMLKPEIDEISGEIKKVIEENVGLPENPKEGEQYNVDKDKLPNVQLEKLVPQVKPVLAEEKEAEIEPPEVEADAETEKDEKQDINVEEPEKDVIFSKRNLEDDFIANKLLSEGRYAEAYSTIDKNYLLTRREVKVGDGNQKITKTYLMRRTKDDGDTAKDYEVILPSMFANECGITDKDEARELYKKAIKMISDSKTIVNTYKDVWAKKNMEGDALDSEGRAILDGIVSKVVTGKTPKYAEIYEREGLSFDSDKAKNVVTFAVSLEDNSSASKAFRESILNFGVLEKKEEELENTTSEEENEVKTSEERRTEEERAEIAKGVERGYNDVAEKFFGKPSEKENAEEPVEAPSETPVPDEEEHKESETNETHVENDEQEMTTQSVNNDTNENVDTTANGNEPVPVDNEQSNENNQSNNRDISKIAEELNHFISIRDGIQKLGVDSPEVKESLENVQNAISSLLTEINEVAKGSISTLGSRDLSNSETNEDQNTTEVEEKMEGVGTEEIIPELTDFNQGGKTEKELASDRALGHADESVWEQILADPDLKAVTDEDDNVVGQYQINRDDESAIRRAKDALEREKENIEAEQDENRAHKDLVEYFTEINSKDKYGFQRDEATVRAESEAMVKGMEAEGSENTPVQFIELMKQTNPQVYESIQVAHRNRLEKHKEEVYSNYEHSEDGLNAQKIR